MSDWSLDDVEKTAKNNTQSFFVPRIEERRTQKAGDLVQLHFILEAEGEGLPRAERMWVEVTQPMNGQGQYSGILTSDPVQIRGIAPGDTIVFEPRHIASTLIRKGDPRWIECADKKSFVSEMAFHKGEMLRFAYREKPDKEDDSGWRFFTGHESDDYTNNPQNIRICVIGWLLSFDPSIDLFVREEAGAVFERRTIKEGWKQVTDWKPPQ